MSSYDQFSLSRRICKAVWLEFINRHVSVSADKESSSALSKFMTCFKDVRKGDVAELVGGRHMAEMCMARLANVSFKLLTMTTQAS